MLTHFFKKITSLVLITSLVSPSYSIIFAADSLDFNIKFTHAWDETYNTSIAHVSSFNTDITLQFIESSHGGPEEYSLNLPSGFIYQSHDTIGNTCANFVVQNASNGNYYFTFNGAVGCIAKTTFTYRVSPSSLAGTQNIFLLSKSGLTWSSAADISLEITSINSITKAVTADVNGNGNIDAYMLSFATLSGITASTLSGITVAGVNIWTAHASGALWILPFSDNLLGTGDTPQIWGTFNNTLLWNNSVNETDGAAPFISTIAGFSTTRPTINIGTGTFTMMSSEPLSPNSIGNFSLKLGTGTIAGSFSLTGNLSTLIFTPLSPLLAGTYTLSNTTGATDWSAGANILTQSFPSLIVPDITAPSTGSIVINTGATTTKHQIVSLLLNDTDNIWVTQMMISNSPVFNGAVWESYATIKTNWSLASGNAGIQTVYVKFRDAAGNESPVSSANITIIGSSNWGGWGVWGPSLDYCVWGDFSGNFYDSKCGISPGQGSMTLTGILTTPIPMAPWIPTLSASPTNLSVNTLGTKYFVNLEEAKKYLLNYITHPGIIKLSNTYEEKLTMSDAWYFLSVDKTLYEDYNKAINAYVLLFMRIQDAVSGKVSANIKSDGRFASSITNSGIILVKNFLDRYVSREYIAEKNITIYRTKNFQLTKPLTSLENKIMRQFDALLASDTISRSEYETAVQAYDDFILHLMIYRDYGKTAQAKERALSAIKIFMITYKKKIIDIDLSDELIQKQKEYNGE